MKDKAKLLAAKPDVEAAIKKHGYEAVRYIVNKLAQQRALEKALAKEKRKARENIDAIRRQLQK